MSEAVPTATYATKAIEEIKLLKMEKAENASLRELLFHKDARIAELEAALKPFADEADRWDDGFDDAEPLYDNGFEQPAPLVGDLRNARSKLEGKSPNAETLAAMQELEDGGGEKFASVDDLMKDLNSDA